MFESGALSPTGAIAGNDADVNPASFEPHYETITRPDQVEVYESILGDVRRRPRRPVSVTATQYLRTTGCCPADSTKPPPSPILPSMARHRPIRIPAARAIGSATKSRSRPRGRLPCAWSCGTSRSAYRWAHNLEPYDRGRAEALRRLLHVNVVRIIGCDRVGRNRGALSVSPRAGLPPDRPTALEAPASRAPRSTRQSAPPPRRRTPTDRRAQRRRVPPPALG